MRLAPGGLLFVTAGTILAWHAKGTAVSAPFVGCESSGQTETAEAPKGTSRSVPISPEDAKKLAYYKSADGIGVLGPRGWNCEGVSGSSGSALYLSPKPIRHSMAGWEGLEGAVIEVNYMNGDTSGRYDIAQIIARVFPAYRAFAVRAMDGIDLPFPTGPYPKDTLRYKGKTMVEYRTPARTDGLGNFESWIGKNELPIVGAAMLVFDPPPKPGGEPHDAVRLSVRMPPGLMRLTSAIVTCFERDTTRKGRD